MKNKGLVLSALALVVVLLFGGCFTRPAAEVETETPTAVSSIDGTPTPRVIPTYVPTATPVPRPTHTPTPVPTPTLEPTPSPTPSIPFFEEYILDDARIDMVCYPEDVSDYKNGEYILHVDNLYGYQLNLPSDWYEKTKIKKFGYNQYALQEFIVDFDGISRFSNEIKIVSSRLKRDPRKYDEKPDRIIKNDNGGYVEIYETINTSSRIEFNFISDSYSHFYGHVKMTKPEYERYKDEITALIKNISDTEREDENYIEFIDEINGVSFEYPAYWWNITQKNLADESDNSSAVWFEFGQGEEYLGNFFNIYINRDINELYIDNDYDFVLYTGEGKEVRMMIEDLGITEARYTFYIPDYNLRGELWLGKNAYENHQKEIIEIIRSIKAYPVPELELIKKAESEKGEMSTYINEINKYKVVYPSDWGKYLYYGIYSEAEYFQLLFQNEEYGDNIEIHRTSYSNSEIIDKNEYIATKSGLRLYKTWDTSDNKKINIEYCIYTDYVYVIYIYMATDFYNENIDDINALLESIDIIK